MDLINQIGIGDSVVQSWLQKHDFHCHNTPNVTFFIKVVPRVSWTEKCRFKLKAKHFDCYPPQHSKVFPQYLSKYAPGFDYFAFLCVKVSVFWSVSICVFSLQYSEKALYNQLCFYRFIFDWEYAVSKVLQGEEKSKTIYMHICCLYLTLKSHFSLVTGLIFKVFCSTCCENRPAFLNLNLFLFCCLYYSAAPPLDTEIKLVEMLLKFEFWCPNNASSQIHIQHSISNQWLNVNLLPRLHLQYSPMMWHTRTHK